MLRFSLLPLLLVSALAQAAPLTMGVVLGLEESFTDQPVCSIHGLIKYPLLH